MSEEQDYEWYETSYGKFRVTESRFGTWNSFGEDDAPFITAGKKEVCISGTRFHMEGLATNWANCITSKKFDGVVGGKL